MSNVAIRPLAGVPEPAMHTTLGRGLRVTGDVIAQQDVLLEGHIRGNIDLPDHALTIAPQARLDGRVFARAVTVAGTVSGEVTARVRVQVVAGARVSGEVTAPRLVVEDGALVQARVDTRRSDAAIKVAQYRFEKRLGAVATR